MPHPISVSTTAWVLLAVLIVVSAFVFSEITPWHRVGDQASTWVLLRLAAVRTPWLTDVANGINAAGSGWGVTVLGVSVAVLTMVFRRWRHLAVFLGSLFFLEEVGGNWIYAALTRPRPYGVLIIGSWGGYSAPSIPVTAVTVFGMGALYGLVVPGRPRTYGKAAAAVVIAVLCLARLYLAVDPPDDASSASRSGLLYRSRRSVTSPRTRYSPSSTAGAGPPMSTSAAGAAMRSGWQCTISLA